MDATSVFKILAVEKLVGERLALSWTSVPGMNYRVAWKPNLSDLGWLGFSDVITAVDSTTSWTNRLSLPNREMFLGVQVGP